MKNKRKTTKERIVVRNVQEKTAESLDIVENSNFITRSTEPAVRKRSENSHENTSVGVILSKAAGFNPVISLQKDYTKGVFLLVF